MQKTKLPKQFRKLGVEVKKSGIHGWGLFATRDFKKGDLIGTITGKILPDDAEETSFTITLEDGRGHLWSMEPNAPFGFANHSVRPNAEIPRSVCPCLYALRRINQGDEITFDYGERWAGVK